MIKHNVSRFCEIYSQVLRLNKSWTSVADALRRAWDLFMSKNAKKTDFAFEHCWVLLKDHSKWVDGWSHVKSSMLERKSQALEGEVSNLVDVTKCAGVGCNQRVGALNLNACSRASHVVQRGRKRN